MTHPALFQSATRLNRHLHCKAIVWFACLLTVGFLLPAINQAADNPATQLELQPHPSLTPQAVVEFQLASLQNNSKAGIEATYRFASPANKKVTGPLLRFSRLFQSAQYQPMLKNNGTEVKLVSNNGLEAQLLAGVVDASGDLHWYRFQLSKQTQSPFQDCWMTDAVYAVAHPGRSA